MIRLSTNQVVDRLQDAIKNEKPYYLGRIGDGAIAFFREVPNTQYKIYRSLRNRGMLNYVRGFELLKHAFLTVIKKSDIIGIGTSAQPLGPNQSHISIPELKKLGVNVGSLVTASHAVTRERPIGSVEGMAKLLNGTPVNILNCHASNLEAMGLDKLLKTKVGYTPYLPNPRPMFMDLELTGSGWPGFVHDNMLTQIKEPVVLLGTGGTGKLLGIYLRDRCGKVVIDMGAVLDAWCGKITRGHHGPGKAYAHCVVKPKND